jgi:signal transduction histidine kinase
MRMASGLVHDINNSLTPIIGFTDHLLDPSSTLPEDVRKCLDYVRSSARDIADMIELVRQFYRRRDEGEPFSSVQLNTLVNQVVQTTLARWQNVPRINGQSVDVSTVLDPDLPDIFGNEPEIGEALINLLLNAADAMPKGGVITICTRCSRPADNGSPNVVLEVRDTGVGMDDLTRQLCLEPFFSTKGPRCTGLGLSVVYGVVHRHGATINVESQPGQGTTVRIVFKAIDSPALGMDQDLRGSPMLP